MRNVGVCRHWTVAFIYKSSEACRHVACQDTVLVCSWMLDTWVRKY